MIYVSKLAIIRWTHILKKSDKSLLFLPSKTAKKYRTSSDFFQNPNSMTAMPKSAHLIEMQLIWYFGPCYALSALSTALHCVSIATSSYGGISVKFSFLIFYDAIYGMLSNMSIPSEDFERKHLKRSKYWPARSFWPPVFKYIQVAHL